MSSFFFRRKMEKIINELSGRPETPVPYWTNLATVVASTRLATYQVPVRRPGLGFYRIAQTVAPPPPPDAVPVPLIFGFHGRNQTHIQFRTQDASNIQTELGSRAVMAYLKSQGGPGWNFAEEVEPNVAFWIRVYTEVDEHGVAANRRLRYS